MRPTLVCAACSVSVGHGGTVQTSLHIRLLACRPAPRPSQCTWPQRRQWSVALCLLRCAYCDVMCLPRCACCAHRRSVSRSSRPLPSITSCTPSAGAWKRAQALVQCMRTRCMPLLISCFRAMLGSVSTVHAAALTAHQPVVVVANQVHTLLVVCSIGALGQRWVGA